MTLHEAMQKFSAELAARWAQTGEPIAPVVSMDRSRGDDGEMILVLKLADGFETTVRYYVDDPPTVH